MPMFPCFWARLALVGSVLAAVTPGAHALDLVQAYEAALAHDATLRATRAATEAALERVPMARAQLLPNISLSASRTHNDLQRTQENLLGRMTTTSDRYFGQNQSLTLRQPLWRKAALVGLDQAYHQVDDAQAVLDAEVRNLAVKVTSAYLDALLARDRVALLEVLAHHLQVQLDAARKGFAAGRGTRTDIDEVQARLDLHEAQRLEARQTVEFTERQLRLLTGLDLVDGLQGVDGERLQQIALPPQTLTEHIERARQLSPDVRALTARVEVARLEIDRARAGHWPTLDALVQITRSGSETVTSPSSSYTNRTVSLQLNVPLYAGGQVSASTRMAVANLTQAEERLEGLQRELEVRVHQAHRGVTEGWLKVRAQEQAVRSADQLVLSSERSRLAGVRSTLDVLNAQDRLQGARRDLAEARYDYLLARIQLASLTGDDLPEVMRLLIASGAPGTNPR